MGNKSYSNRREFLVKSMSIVGVGMIAVTVPSLINSCGNSSPTSNSLTPTDINISNYPELQNVGGFKKVSVSGKNSGFPFIIIRKSTSSFTVLSSICLHEGCEVNNPDIANKTILCHCHGSRFNLDGGIINGPTSQPLTSYPATFNSTTSILTFNS